MVVSTPAKLSSVIAEFDGGNCLTGNITAEGSGLTCLSAFAGLSSQAAGIGQCWDIITTDTTGYQFRAETGVISYDIYVIGGGGSGGTASTDSGREKNSNGGGAGGTAFRNIPVGSISSANITIGAGGAANGGSSGNGAARSGFTGGTTTFTGILGGSNVFPMSGTGGGHGFGSRQVAVAENTATPDVGTWGAVGAVTGGVGVGGQENWQGGGNLAWTIGGDQSRATSGGSVNFSGELPANLNGIAVTGGGLQTGPEGPTPSLPESIRFNTDADIIGAIDREEFRGGLGQQHSSGGPVTGLTGGEYGAGGGSGSAESSTANAQAGSDGAVIIIYRKANDVAIPEGAFVVLNYSNANGALDLTESRLGTSENPGISWADYTTFLPAGQMVPGQNRGYTTNASATYWNGISTSGQAYEQASVLPLITEGTYANGRAAITVAFGAAGFFGLTLGSINLSMYQDNGWDRESDPPRLAATHIVGSATTFGASNVNSTASWFDELILTDHEGRTLTLPASSFPEGANDITATSKTPALRMWNWLPSAEADWGDFNPRTSGGLLDAAATGNFQWGTGNVTAEFRGYAL